MFGLRAAQPCSQPGVRSVQPAVCGVQQVGGMVLFADCYGEQSSASVQVNVGCAFGICVLLPG